MAEMKAKFAGHCKLCGGAFDEGTRILWTRGEGARHLPDACSNEVPLHDGPPGFRKFMAKFAGKCRNCWEPVELGEPIWYAKVDGKALVFHEACETVVTAAPQPAPTRVYGGGEVQELVVEPTVPNGRYTICLDGPDDRVYVRLSKGFDNAPGTQTVSWAHYAGDGANDPLYGNWVGFGTMRGRELRVWRKMQEVVPDRVLLALETLMDSENWVEYGEAYAVEFGRCFRCDSELRVPASLCRGVGPECAKILGIVVSKTEVEAWVRENAMNVTDETDEEAAERREQVDGLLQL